MMMDRYFDANATSPLRPEARAALERAIDECWQNPSSPYRAGARVHARLEAARNTVASVMGVEPEAVVFNSGATEGNRAVLEYWRQVRGPDTRIAASAVEHPAVLENARHLWPKGVALMAVDEQGRVAMDSVERATKDGASLVSLMAANNENGVHQAWLAAIDRCRECRVASHIDASQWIGREPLDGLGRADFVTASGHKFGGPKGVGFLLISEQQRGFRGQRGGAQENDHRAGTENVPAIIGMAAALTAAERERNAVAARWAEGRARFESALRETIPGVRIWGEGANRLANTSSILLPIGNQVRWVRLLDRAGFSVSTGSACATGKEGPSHVLAAMGATDDEARRTIRVSALPSATPEDWIRLAAAFTSAFEEIRQPETGSQVIQL